MYRDLKMAFFADEGLRCVFHNVVVKVESLRTKYPGGLKAFVNKYSAFCNRDLAVDCSMNSYDLDETIMDIQNNGLVFMTDYVCLDATDWSEGIGRERGIPESRPVDLKVPWLKAHTHKGGTVIQFVANPMVPEIQDSTEKKKTAEEAKKEMLKEERLARDSGAPKKTQDQPLPRKEECEVLYYGRFEGDDEIIFLPKELVDYNIKIHKAMDKAANLTWGEVKKRFPEIWSLLEECELPTFEEWLEEREPQGGMEGERLQVLASARNEYENLTKWQRMPFPDEQFDTDVILESYPNLQYPHSGCWHWIPSEITNKFGRVDEGFDVDAYVTFHAKDLRKVIRAFRKHGYICRRNDSKIEAASGD
jgi:hypothetical protein